MQSMTTKAVEYFRKNLAALCAGRQDEVAKAAGISRVHLSRIINGHACPSLEIAAKLCKVLGVSLSEVTDKKNLPTPLDAA